MRGMRAVEFGAVSEGVAKVRGPRLCAMGVRLEKRLIRHAFGPTVPRYANAPDLEALEEVSPQYVPLVRRPVQFTSHTGRVANSRPPRIRHLDCSLLRRARRPARRGAHRRFGPGARPGTPAAGVKDTLSIEEKKRRLYELQELIREQSKTYSQKMLGTTQKVLVEGFSVKTSKELYGRSDNNKIVNFPSAKNMIGKFTNVMITEIRTNTLYGEIV